MAQGVTDGVCDLMTEGVGVTEGGTPGKPWGIGVECPLWLGVMTGEAAKGGPLITEGIGVVALGECAAVGTKPGKTGVIGTNGAGCLAGEGAGMGTGVAGAERLGP